MLGNICFSEQIFYGKQSLGAPDVWSNCALKHLPGYKARKSATRTDVVLIERRFM